MRRLLVPALAGLALVATPPAASGQSLADYDYEYLRFRGLGLDAGYIWADRVADTEQLSLRVDLGYLGPGVRIIPSVSYWRSELKSSEIDDLATRLSDHLGVPVEGSDLGPIEWSDLSLSLDGHVVWNTPIDVLTFVGGGIGLHALNGQGAAVDDTFVEDLLDAIAAGFSFLAGAEFEPVQRLRVYGEGRYTAVSGIQYLSARAGLQFMLHATDGAGGAVPAPTLSGRAP